MNPALTIELTALLAAASAVALGAVALLRGANSTVHRVFAAGMLLFAGEQALHWFVGQTLPPSEVVARHNLMRAVGAFLPGVWLVFSLSYGRGNRRQVLRRWRWIVVALLASPLLIFLVAGGLGSNEWPYPRMGGGWDIRLDSAGYLLALLWIVASTLIVANLERTLRGAVGRVRWQMKFLVLGLAAVFGLRIYAASFTLLFSYYSTDLLRLNSIGLLAGGALISVGLWRSRALDLDIYFSRTVLQRSIVFLMVGGYLLAVGLLSQLLSWIGLADTLYLRVLFVFLALIVLSTILLSDRLRQGFRVAISRHFRRPVHDYRRLWSDFIGRTYGVHDVASLSRAVAAMIAELFQFHSVSVWTVLDGGDAARLQASLAVATAGGSAPAEVQDRRLLSAIPRKATVIELKLDGAPWVADFRSAFAGFLEPTDDRYLVPIVLRDELLGFMTLGQRVRNRELTLEDRELLQTLSHQLASQLFSLRASTRLQRSRELESFQTVSTFFVHDLKNVASRLSLAIKNLPRHFDNPDFRDDMLRTISQSVDEMQVISGRLSAFKDGLRLRLQPIDLNSIVRDALREFEQPGGSDRVRTTLSELPELSADPQQLRRVIDNLLLNAHEAAPDESPIRVRTTCSNGAVFLEVSDSGCGMSKQFLAERLFRPFQTTKKRGIGIGLYQSRAIVEAHGGRIEVESVEKEGSRFRVVLPSGDTET